ncbi:MAG: YkgJ family cysteine cluster protein [Candidatus Nezhaarchaeota archaeon]|nr:YkgJ family cysteine cluster protein [Candidatus Nezhaarchaeota archaeon]
MRLTVKLPTLRLDCVVNGKLCGRCCYNTEMPLTLGDVNRIKRLGFSESHFIDKVGGLPRLRNVEGHCVFLNPHLNSCTIYPMRPEGCRLYPLLYDLECGKVTVDPLCPQSHTIPKWLARKLSKSLLNLVSRLERERGFQ